MRHHVRPFALAAALAVAVACADRAGTDRDDDDLPPGETVTIPAGWERSAPEGSTVEWWAPPGWFAEADTSALGPCDARTPPADSAVAPVRDDSAMLTSIPLTFALRRGTREALLGANHFGVRDDTLYFVSGAGGSGVDVDEGPGWLVLSGDYWVRHHHPDGGLRGQQPVQVLLATADVGDGCHLAIVSRGGEDAMEAPGWLDTLSLVMRTVRSTRPGR